MAGGGTYAALDAITPEQECTSSAVGQGSLLKIKTFHHVKYAQEEAKSIECDRSTNLPPRTWQCIDHFHQYGHSSAARHQQQPW